MAVALSAADQIFNQVQMKAEEGKCSDKPVTFEQQVNRECQEQAEQEIVCKHVMIFTPPHQRVVRAFGQEFSDKAKTIEIRNNTCQRNSDAFATGKRSTGIGNYPASKDVIDRTHETIINIYRKNVIKRKKKCFSI